MGTTRVVGEALRRRARSDGERPFVGCGGDRLTFAEADARSDRVAAGLAATGVRPGDRVAVVAPNRVEVLELFFALAKLGAIQVPVNVFLKGEWLRYQLADSEASTVVGDAAGLEAVREVAEELPELRTVVSLDDAAGLPARTVSYAALEDGPAPAVALDASSPMSIVYTSGTTGLPKGCLLPHGYYTHAPSASGAMMGYQPTDVVYTALPMFHGWARGIVMAGVVHGLQVVLDPDFSATAAADRLAACGATVFTGVGAMGMAMLGAQPAARPRLRAALVIPFPPEDCRRFEERFGGRVLSQMYGQTECGAISFARIDEEGRPGSMGRPAPTFEVRLVDEADDEVADGEVGEVVVRPRVPFAMYLGYWRKPEETLEARRNLWHHTGDYARMDDDGYLYFVDRKSDAIRRRGENVSSVQLEQAIAAHPKVAECAVHAVPSELTEDEIKACLVVTAELSPEELFAYFRDRLPYFAVPRYVEVVESLPRNATMRVMKHVLRERGLTPATWDLQSLGLTVARAERR